MKIFFSIMCLFISLTAFSKPYDARLSDYEYPFPVQFFDLEAQGQKLQMAYMDLRPEVKSEKVIVLLHGKNFGGFYFDNIAKEFLNKGYRVIIPDQIGFGKSSKPFPFQYSFQLLASSTDKLLQSLGIVKYGVLSHSMGGMVASRLALMYPEKVERLILVCPIGLEDYRLLVPYKNADDLYAGELKTTSESIKKYQQDNYYAGHWKPEYDKLIEPASGQTEHKEFPLVARSAALTSEMIYTQPVIYEFKNIKVPTTLIIGLDDKTAPGRPLAKPEDQKKLGDYTQLGKMTKKSIPRSTLIEIKGRGHVPFLENFEEFKKILNPLI